MIDANYGGSKMAKANPKNPYKWKKLTLEWKKMLKTNVEWALCGD